MTQRPTLTTEDANRFIHTLLPLMVQHGLSHLRPRTGGGGFLGLTPEGQFVTRDLQFEFMSPAEHRSAAQAYGLDPATLRDSAGPRGQHDAETFVRALGKIFDVYGVLGLTFDAGGWLGFKAEAQTRHFVTEGITVDARPTA